MWHPILERGNGDWVGTTGDSRLWIGTREAETAPVALDNPVFLWPFLERRLADVAGELREHWAEFALPESASPGSLVESIVRSAVDGGRPYWVDRALDWLDAMANDAEYQGTDVYSILHKIAEADPLPQAARHRALRIIKSSRQRG